MANTLGITSPKTKIITVTTIASTKNFNHGNASKSNTFSVSKMAINTNATFTKEFNNKMLASKCLGLSRIDKIIPDPRARDAAKLELLKLQGSQELEAVRVQMSAIIAEAGSTDPWTSRARPSFLYVMYAIILWAIPMGLIAATQPQLAQNIAAGMNAYLGGIPEPLWTLFGTGYLGYTVARQWGKAKGTDQ